MNKKIAAIGAVLLVCITEATLRIVLGLGNPILIQSDPACGYILKPSQSVHRFFVNTRINRFGMRSDDVSETKPEGQLRILFLGDSITYGTTQVDQSEIFTQILRRTLPHEVGRPVEVLNASASAWAIENEFQYLRSRGSFGADFVILVLNSGDLSQPVARVEGVGDALPTRKPLTAVGEVWSRFVIPRLFYKAERRDAGIDSSSSTREIIERNLSLLSEMKQLTDGLRTALGIVYVPFRRDVESGASAPIAKELRHWTSAHLVSLLDLTDKESAYPLDAITLQDRTHFNSLGNRLIAAGIEPWLLGLDRPALARSPE